MAKKANDVVKEKRYMSLIIGETEYQTFPTKKFNNRKPYVPHDPRQIFSHIPGTVVKILTEPGEKLEPGDAIVILDAMKMMNRVILPDGGTIKTIYVREGETIPRSHLIADLE